MPTPIESGIRNHELNGILYDGISDQELNGILYDILLKKRDRKRLVAAFNELPKFFVANCDAINGFLLKSNCCLEILTRNPEIDLCFFDYLIIDGHRENRGVIRVYRAPNHLREFLVRDNYVILKWEDIFDVYHNKRLAWKYLNLFDKMKKNNGVIRVDYFPSMSVGDLFS